MSIFQETSQKKQKENPEADDDEDEDEENEFMHDETKESDKSKKTNTRSMRYESRHGAVVQVETPKKPIVIEKTIQKRLVRDERSPAVDVTSPTKEVKILSSPAKDNGDIRPTKRLRT